MLAEGWDQRGISWWFCGLHVRKSCLNEQILWKLKLQTTNQFLLVIQHWARGQTKMLRKQLILILREIPCRPRACFILYSIYSEWGIHWRCCQAMSQLLILSPSSDTPLSKWYQQETEMNALGQVAPTKAPVRDKGCRMLRWICPVASNEVTHFSSSPCASKRGIDKTTGTHKTFSGTLNWIWG